ncbi:MAG: DUF58 domain-containing protein [Rhizobiales bacterium]|nr:DUF58 domain-containing protein [Hyphomicrobiales bacterium]
MSTASALQVSDRAEHVSRALPPLLVEAQRIAATVILGVHGRKRSGPGETFWQYRPYAFGDSTQRIDWHKSARSDRTYIRENEWEAANTLWVWPSPSASMRFQSHLSQTTKRDRAQLIALAMANLAVRAHERVAVLGSPFAPGHSRTTLLRMASWLLEQDAPSGLPIDVRIPRYSTVLMLGDFLEKPETIAASLSTLAAAGVSGHLVQVVDPSEETLPYAGRIEFRGMTGRDVFLAGKTENLREAYQQKFQEQRAAIRDLALRLNWTFTVHRTDAPPLALLLALHALIGGEKSRVAAPGMV